METEEEKNVGKIFMQALVGTKEQKSWKKMDVGDNIKLFSVTTV